MGRSRESIWDILEHFTEHLTFEHVIIWGKRIQIEGRAHANALRLKKNNPGVDERQKESQYRQNRVGGWERNEEQ